MDKEFVPYEEARKLKGLGFNEPCFGYYWEKSDDIMGLRDSPKTNSQLTDLSWSELNGLRDTVFMSAPLYQQAFRWFREGYGLQKSICPDTESKRFYFFFHKDNEEDREPTNKSGNGYHGLHTGFNTYEEAQLACLRELIRMVKK